MGGIAGAARREDCFARLEAAGLGSVEILDDTDGLALWTSAAGGVAEGPPPGAR